MAVDTANKRFSMIGLVSVTKIEQKVPSGVIGTAAREMLLHAYSGIAFNPPGGAVPSSMFYALLAGQGSSF